MGNTIERCEVVNDLNGGGVKAVRLTDGRYVTEKLARELAVKLEEELDQWRHIHFNGERDGHFSGEYLERTSQLDLARHFYELGKQSGGGFEIPADLEKAADEMALRAFPEKKSYSTVIDRVVDYNARDRENYRDGIIAGAKWDRSQMMREAVEGKIAERVQGKLYARCQVPKTMGVEFGDKVRIIVVKED